jgi:predicted transcriptional regulator YheO
METITDELPFLRSLMKGIAALFGPNCEVVLHDHKGQPYEHTIVAIENGHVTGRSVGDCGTNLGLEVLRGTENKEKNEAGAQGGAGDRYNYATQMVNGRTLRSSSIYIRDKEGKVAGALCINLDVTDVLKAEETIGRISQNPYRGEAKQAEEAVQGPHEVFARDVNELCDELIQEARHKIGKPLSEMSREDKLEVLKYLDDRGAFLIKKAGDKVSKFLDISKYTMYSYLDSIRGK